MEKYQLERELDDLGLSFQMYVDGIVFFTITPFILEKEDAKFQKKPPGLYLVVQAEFEEKIPYHYEFDYREHPYEDFWITLQIIKTDKGFEIVRKNEEEMIKDINESIYNWIYENIEEQLESAKIRLLFLYPQIQNFFI